MSKVGTLIRAGIKSNFGLVIMWRRVFMEKKDCWIVPIIGLSLLGVLPMLAGIVIFIQQAYSMLKPLGRENAILDMGIAVGQSVIVLFGVYYVVAALYFSRDMEMLIPLPLRPSEVMISKFAVIVINEYLTVAIIVLPILITYGILAGAGVGYWVNAAIVYLVMPVIPLSIVSVLVVAMMRIINSSRKKDILIIAGSMVMLLAVLGFQFLVQQAGNGSMRAQDITAFLSSPGSLPARIGTWFPPGIWAAKSIYGGFSGTGLAYLGIFLGTSFVVVGALMVLSEQLFYGGVIGLGETAMRKQRLTQDELLCRISSGRRAITAIFAREWRIMNRTPVFLLNGVIMVLLFPLLLLFILRTGPLASLAISRSGVSASSILLVALFLTVCSCINGVSSSAFSREGAQFWISKAIPVAPREQAAAKFLHSYLISLLGISAAFIVVILLVHPKAVLLITALGLALIASAVLTAAGMFIDLARPLLDWTNPQKAIKQNLNVLLAMMCNAGILTVAFFNAKALLLTRLADSAVVGIVFMEIALAAALGYRALLAFAEKRYREIEI